MSTNPYKSFIPYLVNINYTPLVERHLPVEFEKFISKDPSGGAWGTMGLIKTFDGIYVTELSSNRSMLVVQFNERILPGKVRNEKLQQRVEQLERMEGRKLSKKEYAQLRDETEFDLLPKAFIRRSQVPVFFNPNGQMLVCTSSQKKADSVIFFLSELLDHLNHWKISTDRPVEQVLSTLTVDGQRERGGLIFEPTDAAVLKGPSRRTIRIKDRDLASAEVQALIDPDNSDYQVHELAVKCFDPDDDGDLLCFSVNDNLIFKRCVLPDVKATAVKEDQHGLALLCAQTYEKVLEQVFAMMGGMAERPVEAKTQQEEEEEL